MKKGKGHTGKLAFTAKDHIKGGMKDMKAHSSNHEHHGEGDQKGMHGFGDNWSPPEGGYQHGGDNDNCESC